MRIAIVGGGPAGLYLGYLLKRRQPLLDVAIFEQNRPDATFGFGVVFSDKALEFLVEDDRATFDAISPHLETWSDITVRHAGATIRIDGVGFAAIGRLKLLQLLRERADSAGVRARFARVVTSVDDLGPADLIVAADGVNSVVRRSRAGELGTTERLLANRFAWFGTTHRFETLTQTFRRAGSGVFNAHHYRYAPDMSTFIVEVDAGTFTALGFEQASEEETRRRCEEVFAEELEGHTLVSNRSVWRRFPVIRNERWSAGNVVLMGDALRTAHFSIGSGTRLAMEDAIALDRALAASPNDIPAALQRYEEARRPVVEKLVAAANASAAWYEEFASHMTLPPLDFAMSYLTRSGRVDLERLRRVSPRFLARWEARPQ